MVTYLGRERLPVGGRRLTRRRVGIGDGGPGHGRDRVPLLIGALLRLRLRRTAAGDDGEGDVMTIGELHVSMSRVRRLEDGLFCLVII